MPNTSRFTSIAPTCTRFPTMEKTPLPKTVNSVHLLGHSGRDPDVRTTSSGALVATFSLATQARHKDKDGNWHDVPEWHALVSFGKTAEIVRDYVRKGSQLFVEGRLHTRSWDDSGTTRYLTEIILNDLVLLGGKARQDQRPAKNIHGVEITDEDIPNFDEVPF